MSFLNYIISLVGTMKPVWSYSLFDFIALAFLCTIPFIFDSFWRKK